MTVRIFVVLHVLSMFAAVAVTGGGDLLFYRIAQSRDAAAIRTAGAVFGRLARVIPVLFGVGAVFGIVAVFVHQFDPFATWLVLAYILFVLGLVLGNVVNGAWSARVTAAADEPEPALDIAISDPRGRIGIALFWLIVAALVFLMVTKPFS
jgi:hypothetical protein